MGAPCYGLHLLKTVPDHMASCEHMRECNKKQLLLQLRITITGVMVVSSWEVLCPARRLQGLADMLC